MIRKIDLSGEWGFRLDEEKKGINCKYWIACPNDIINLPSTTSAEEKGNENHDKVPHYLTDKFAFEGWAWYYKKIHIGDLAKEKKLILRLERTRITKVWINGIRTGEYDSLCTPHIYDISDFSCCEDLEICIMVSNTDYPTKGGHMTSPDTQSNWNGITGEISLEISEKSGIRGIQAYPDIKTRSVKLRFGLDGIGETDISIWGASSDGKLIDTQLYHITADFPEINVYLGDDASLWSEYTPVTYTLKAALPESPDIYTVTFGLREFISEGLDLKINGNKVHLRGKHDGMIFPLKGAAPATVEEWYDVLRIAKSWGINHYRFHTCCPPDAAFTAADMLGIYMQPELPFWGTVHAPDDSDFNKTEQEYLIEEGRRILKTFGNHPSFVMMSLGNELWGSPERLNTILQEYHELDNRHLYTQGSNNFQFYPNIQPYDDFFSGVRLSKERLIRGSYATCDAPLGFVQTDEPNTVHSYDNLIFPVDSGTENDDDTHEIEIQYGTGVKKVKVNGISCGLIPTKPIITHEVGQYCTYPDFKEINKYTGALKPYNLEIFRKRLDEKNMLSYAENFHTLSGRLAFQCYKLEIEAAMRSRYISGFQLLDLQDFSGQGTALVGMLNAFMEEKSFVSDNSLRDEWIGFCSDVVILAEINSFIVTVKENITVPVWLRYMRPETLSCKKICWALGEINGELIIPDGFTGLGKIGEISLEFSCAGKYTLEFRLDDIRAENDILPTFTFNRYDFYAFEKTISDFSVNGKSVKDESTLYMTESLSEAKRLLSDGEKVIYFPGELRESVPGFYCTDFWCYPMFRSISESMGREVPVGTLGLWVDESHPAVRSFAHGMYSNPQWYHIISHSDCAVLNGTPEEFRPIVQVIDNFERNHKLGLLYEAKVGAGKLIICTSRLSEITDRPEVQAFAENIINYVHSDSFDPSFELTTEDLDLE